MALVCVSTARCCHAAGAGRRMWQGNLRPQPSSASTRAYVPRRDLGMGGLGGLRTWVWAASAACGLGYGRPRRRAADSADARRAGGARAGRTRLEGGLVHQQRRPPPRLHQLLPAPEIRVNIRVAESESISNRGTWPVCCTSPSAVLQPPPRAHAASSAPAAAKHSPSCRIAPPFALCLQTSPAYGLLDPRRRHGAGPARHVRLAQPRMYQPSLLSAPLRARPPPSRQRPARHPARCVRAWQGRVSPE